MRSKVTRVRIEPFSQDSLGRQTTMAILSQRQKLCLCELYQRRHVNMAGLTLSWRQQLFLAGTYERTKGGQVMRRPASANNRPSTLTRSFAAPLNEAAAAQQIPQPVCRGMSGLIGTQPIRLNEGQQSSGAPLPLHPTLPAPLFQCFLKPLALAEKRKIPGLWGFEPTK